MGSAPTGHRLWRVPGRAGQWGPPLSGVRRVARSWQLSPAAAPGASLPAGMAAGPTVGAVPGFGAWSGGRSVGGRGWSRWLGGAQPVSTRRVCFLVRAVRLPCGCRAVPARTRFPGCARRHCSKTLTLREAERLRLAPSPAGLVEPWLCDPLPFWRGTLVWVLPAEHGGWSNACFVCPAAQPAERLLTLVLLGEAFVSILGWFFSSLPPLTVVEIWHSKYFFRCRFRCLAERI